MSRPLARRGFLRGLTSLPLIGGSVALIGQPTAVAGRPSLDLLAAYKTWLHFEHRFLDPQRPYRGAYKILDNSERVELPTTIGGCHYFAGDSGSFHGPRQASAMSRAALVLSTVGCEWHDDKTGGARA